MADRQNKFMGARPGNSLIRDITKQVNDSNVSARAAQFSKTSRKVEDLNIDLIDTDELNEQLFGYEDLYKIEESIDTIGNKSVIFVYEKDDGRYLCYAGNQRLLASKNKKEEKITCVIDGPEPDKENRIEQYIFMNAQRTPRPYYIAQQLKAYESVLRSKGEKSVSDIIEKKFGIKVRMQQIYKQILTLSPVLQELFKNDDIQLKYLLEVCTKVPAGKENIFATTLNTKIKEEGCSKELINAVYNEIILQKNASSAVPVKRYKNSQIFKSIMSMPYYEPDEVIIIPDKKKKEILAQIDTLEDYLNRIKKACK